MSRDYRLPCPRYGFLPRRLGRLLTPQPTEVVLGFDLMVGEFFLEIMVYVNNVLSEDLLRSLAIWSF